MATSYKQPSRAITVIPDDTVPTPNPAAIIRSSTCTTTTATKLVDSTALFTTYSIKFGDILWNTTSNRLATVVTVDSDTILSVDGDFFPSGDDYELYRLSDSKPFLFQATLPVSLAVSPSGGGAVVCVTAGGDEVTLYLGAGEVSPVQLTHVKRTGSVAALAGVALFN